MKDNILGNVDWNKFYQKPETNPETWYINEKFLEKGSFIYHYKDLQKGCLMVMFSKTLTETFTIKNFHHCICQGKNF